MKKILLKSTTYLILTAMLISLMPAIMPFSVSAEPDPFVNRSRALMVSGNKIVYEDDPQSQVRLVGMNIPSLEWGASGESLFTSLAVSCDEWGSNLIRLPVTSSYWRGEKDNDAAAYRALVDKMIRAVASRGKYIIIDLHEYHQPNEKHLAFWQEVAQIYGNNPAVLFGLLNEPHDINWDVWKYGGTKGIGHQRLVEAIRDTGAKNILIAAGRDWGFQLGGLVNGDGTPSQYFLTDQGSNDDTSKTGNGIMYDSHVYPWKSGRDASLNGIRKLAPLLIGENGWEKTDPNGNSVSINHAYWAEDLFNWIDDAETYGVAVNWTGWCLHPTSTPRVLEDWNYNTTAYWGTYAKERLLSYGMVNKPETVNYINNFEPDMNERYTLTKDGTDAELTKTSSAGSVDFTFNRPDDATKSIIKMAPSVFWDFSGMQKLQFNLQANQAVVGNNLSIGIEDMDGEIWVKDYTIADINKNFVDIALGDLTKITTIKSDGVINRAIKNIYISIDNAGSGEITVSDLVINRGGSNFPAGFPQVSLGGAVEYANYFTPNLFGEAETSGNASYQVTRDDYDLVACGVASFSGEGRVTLPIPSDWETEKTGYIKFLSKYLTNERPELKITVTTESGSAFINHDPSVYKDELNYVEISISDLDLTGKIKNISINSDGASGRLEIRNVIFTSIKPPKTSFYQPVNTEYQVDFESHETSISIKQKNNGNKAGDYMMGEIIDSIGVDGSKAFKVSFKRASDSGGGYLFCDFPDMNVIDARYIAFMVKNNGEAKNISITLEDTSGNKYLPSIDLKKYDDSWMQYTFDLREAMQSKRKGTIIKVNFYNNTKGIESSYILDDITFSKTIPLLAGRNSQKVFVNDFENDTYLWSDGASGTAGYIGGGKALDFAVNQTITADLPAGWGYFEETQYMTFMAKSTAASIKVSVKKNGLNLLSFQALVMDGWSRIVCPLMGDDGLEDIFGADRLEFSSTDGNEIVIDDLTFTRHKPVKTEADVNVTLSDSSIRLIEHDDFENVTLEKSGTVATIYEGTAPVWTAKKGTNFTDDFTFELNEGMVYKNSSLNYINETQYLTTHKTAVNSGGGLAISKTFETLTADSGIAVVEFRTFYPSMDYIDFSFKDKAGGSTIVKFRVDKNGKMQYGEYYNESKAKAMLNAEQNIPSGQWGYIRAVINLKTSRVKVYYGFDPHNMYPFRSDTEDYPLFYSAKSNVISYVVIDGKGYVNLDDFKVYTIADSFAPIASDVKITGSANVGGTLTASYTYTDGDYDLENGTEVEWFSASDAAFTQNVTSVQKGGLTYVVKPTDNDKYIRVSVTPKNNAALRPVGETVSYVFEKRASLCIISSVEFLNGTTPVGDIAIDGTLDLKGSFKVTNVSGTDATVFAVIARYKGAALLETKSMSFSAPSQEETSQYYTDELTVSANETLKMYIWDNDLSPYSDPHVIIITPELAAAAED